MTNKKSFKYIMFVFTFALIFSFKTNVKALDKFVCYYKNADVIDQPGYTLRLTYENSKATYEFYNSNKKEASSRYTISSSIEGDKKTNNNSVIAITTHKDFKDTISDADFKYGCPNQIYYVKSSVGDIPADADAIIIFGIFKENFTDIDAGVFPIDAATPGKVEPQGSTSVKKCNYAAMINNNKQAKTSLTFAYDKEKIVSFWCDPKVCVASDPTKVQLANENLNYSDFINSKNECPINVYYEVDTLKINPIKKNNSDVKFQKIGYAVPENADKSKDKTQKDLCEIKTVKKVIKMIYNAIRFIAPALIVVLSSIEFAGVVLSGENDKMEKAKKHFVTRLAIGVAILFIPLILELILNMAGIINGNLSDAVCKII